MKISFPLTYITEIGFKSRLAATRYFPIGSLTYVWLM